MDPNLKEESEKLARSWMRHDAAMLRDYLVASVEDPRLNLQSILTRHFLIRALAGEEFEELMREECRFAATINWLTAILGRTADAEDCGTMLYALRRGADNAEGQKIPRFIVGLFQSLPLAAKGVTIPNYIESFLAGVEVEDGQSKAREPTLDTFRVIWARALTKESPSVYAECRERAENADAGVSPEGFHGFHAVRPITVLEPACGSANDYRFFHSYGLAKWLDYTGFDLCAKNIANARALFPVVRFVEGNVFEIAAPKKAFDHCIVHDLFEHLSPGGLQTAVAEICRVTRRGICAGFFSMDELQEHVVRPVDEYHWNTLSMARMKELFAGHEFEAQVLHIGTFLRQGTGCHYTHNPNAYTFLLRASADRTS
jgi:SAM-dependent methyltransferase